MSEPSWHFGRPRDGHTLLFVSNGFAMNPAVRSKLPYDTVKDFSGVARMATSPFIIVAHPSVPTKSLGALIALARARPGDLNYATLGPPTVAKSGFPGYDVQLWMGAAMARAAPRQAISRLGSEIVQALGAPDVHKALTKVGFNPAPLDPDKFDVFIQTEMIRNAKVAREANIRID